MKELTVKELYDLNETIAKNFVVKQMNTVLPWLQLTHLLLHAVKNC